MRQVLGDPEELCANVEHAARAEESNIEREASERADEILGRAAEQAEAVRRELLEPARARAQKLRQRRRAKASLEQKERYLQVRRELIDQVWKRAEERLRALTEDEEAYARTIRALAAAASRALPPGTYTIAADPAGHRLLGRSRLKAIGEQSSRGREGSLSFRRADEPLEAWGGVVLTGEGGRLRVDATFAARLELARQELLEQVVEALVKR